MQLKLILTGMLPCTLLFCMCLRLIEMETGIRRAVGIKVSIGLANKEKDLH